jgi:spore coat polysaccharide biosynthesis protein SpsF (cytidylyltransferase family)/spore coat polysaccharide biosynthesis predicted glycosyltransferase SpsG
MQDRNVVIIIQARVSSTRLPAKHFRKVGDRSVLEWIFERLQELNGWDKIVVSTCKEAGSELYAQYQNQFDYELFEYDGNVNDVVERHNQAMKKYPATHYLFVSGDCLLSDVSMMQKMIDAAYRDDTYLITAAHESIHEGFSIFSKEGYGELIRQTQTDVQRENMGYQVKYPEDKITRIPVDEKYKENMCRISVDNQADLRFMNALFQECKQKGVLFDISSVVDLLHEKPELLLYHAHVKQKQLDYKAHKILLLTEASAQLGWGHLSRMIAMAQELNESWHHGVHFLINEDEKAIDFLIANGYADDYTTYQSETMFDTLAEAQEKRKIDWLIIDGRSFADTETRLFHPGLKVIFYDQLPISRKGDAYILQGWQSQNIQNKAKTDAKIFWGIQTVFLNKKLEYQIQQAKQKEEACLLAFGATNQNNYLEKVVDKLRSAELKIYARPGVYENSPSLENISLVDQNNFYSVVARTKWAICSYGAVFYELLISGATVSVIARNQHDADIVKELVAAQKCQELGLDKVENYLATNVDLYSYEEYKKESRLFLTELFQLLVG